MIDDCSVYPELDLSRMLLKPKCAIHIASVEQANAVIHNAKIQFPERVKNWDVYENNRWNSYAEQTAYTLFYEGDEEPSSMSFADVPWFEKSGYEVIGFEELLITATSDIVESDQPICVLFNMARPQ